MQGLAPYRPATASQTETAPDLATFVERTSTLRLDPWQRHLCERLSRLKDERGQRLLIHAPPQAGKSVIVSQRFPVWLLGHKPTHRVKLACYNVTHAVRFGKVLRELMQSAEYARLFPYPGLRIPALAAQEEWSTAARSAIRDAQPSFKALGLLTGFVGQGADTLIIDDPYSSPQDALSETIRASVWTFWEQSAKVRLNDDTNVVVMFHRYHEEDLAGKLALSPEWERLRYAALADEDASWPDPLHRPPGEKLSPRMSDAFLAEQQLTPSVWLGQFQGRPLPPGGGMLKRGWFRCITPDLVPPLTQSAFGVDLAVSAKTTADFTAAFPLGISAEQNYYLFRPARGQWEPHQARREIIYRVRQFKLAARVGVESVAALSGYVTELRREPELAGFSVIDVPRNSDKVALASTWSPIAEQGRLYLVDDDSGWVEAFLAECEGFPLGAHDDQVDAVGIAMAMLRNRRVVRFN